MDTNAKRILIIDDEEAIANSFAKQLTQIGGFPTDIAIGGQEGLTKLAENEYNLVLLDLVMPETDGLAVLKEMATAPDKYHTPKVMVLTNVSSEDARNDVAEYEIIEFIVKTDIDPDDLIEKINNL